MPSYMLRGIPPGVIQDAKAKAREAGTTLDAVLLRYLATYAEHGNPQAKGAQIANESMTPEERSANAKRAVEARWKKEKGEV